VCENMCVSKLNVRIFVYMPNNYENTSLWRTSLVAPENDANAKYYGRLSSAYEIFRQRAASITARIQSQMPNLTLHDVTHLDALWETASLVAGPNYPLNPLEGFVFGGAVLLHDAALCFEAYRGGSIEVRSNPVWKDAYAVECTFENDNRSDEEKITAADFSALRQLHARQAEDLVNHSWSNPDDETGLFLIDDSHLREHLGQLIGQIAASHHWNIEDVASRLPSQINALGEFPRKWQIDAVKVACLLRCADPLHIDNTRAPDFFHVLLRRKGISFQHWQAQNRLGRPYLDSSDRSDETIVITSTRSFPESDADSWWVAYDAVCLADKEIRSSNALLESRNIQNSPAFKIKRIRGTDSPERMSDHIRAIGWVPCSVEIHVGNIEHLVKTLGGQSLYNEHLVDFLAVAIRELIQNARDAVCAKRIFASGYKGEIRVRLAHHEGRLILLVEDDGIGMSQRVLTGPLLDFGTSFWTSSLVRSEWQGLQSSSFQSVGKFGIGFYAVFMVSDAVKVSSRRYDDGLDSAFQISFPRGLVLRPLLTKGRFLDYDTSTCVTLEIKDEFVFDDNEILIKRNLMNSTNFCVSFPSYISAIVAGIDVDVVYLDPQSHRHEVHNSKFDNMTNQGKWLNMISFADSQNDPVLHLHITKNSRSCLKSSQT
jgi:Histidine kinase-, DNA gyrase B-, and HSP90-like ATPase